MTSCDVERVRCVLYRIASNDHAACRTRAHTRQFEGDHIMNVDDITIDADARIVARVRAFARERNLAYIFIDASRVDDMTITRFKSRDAQSIDAIEIELIKRGGAHLRLNRYVASRDNFETFGGYHVLSVRYITSRARRGRRGNYSRGHITTNGNA